MTNINSHSNDSPLTLLVLGASLMQHPSIQAAKSLGCQVVVVDGNPKALCVPLADTFVPLDLKDKEGIKALALELVAQGRLQGVFTAGTDFSATVSYVGEACGFAVHSYQAACNASHKAQMRQCFKEAGVPSPEFISVAAPPDSSSLDIGAILGGKQLPQSLPLVVKPVDNMGGRGCRLVHNHQELPEALTDACANSRSGQAIVEEYMEGPEFSIDALVYKGTLTICGFADRHIFFPPYFIEMGHTIPTSISLQDKVALIATFAQGVQALGLTCGAAKADIKLTPKGPMIGEIAARLSGGYMSGWTYPYSSNFFLTQQAQAIALGLEPTELLARRKSLQGLPQPLPFTLYEVESTSYCAERAWISIPGQVAKIHGLEETSLCLGVKDVFPRSFAGDYVSFPKNNVEKCGNVLAVDTTWQGATSKAQQCVKSIVLELESPHKATEDFFNVPITELRQENFFPPAAFILTSSVAQELVQYLSSNTENYNPTKTLLEQIPPCFEPYLDSLVDWNYRNLRETLDMAQKLLNQKNFCFNCCDKSLSLVRLWHSCILGGIQGLLYVVSSTFRRND